MEDQIKKIELRLERLEDERCNIDNEMIQLQEELESMKKHDTCEPYY